MTLAPGSALPALPVCPGERGQDSVPSARGPLIAWTFLLRGDDDHEITTRVWQMVTPRHAFAGAIQLVHRAVSGDLAMLARRITGVAA